MASNYDDAIAAAAKLYPRPAVPKFVYGTAGFRMKADLLDSVVFTVGVLAALRSRKLKGQAIGVMITASHNKAEDNGVKLVDPLGDMLEQSWESYATELANTKAEDMKEAYAKVVKDLGVDSATSASVIIARDTRPSGERLVKALIAGLDAAGAKYVDYGVLTTPQLHYLTRATNTQNDAQPFGEVSEEGYYKKLAEAYKIAMRHSKPNGALSIDCANGVGAIALKRLLKYLPTEGETAGGIKVNVVNDRVDDPAVLNEKCGADFVKSGQRAPENFSGKPFERWASYDGDADRILYYFVEEGKVFRLLDGDRIASLAATFIGELVNKAGLSDKLSLAVVQTAYANGASTRYIEQTLKLKVECTPTGVKHLHHVAARYDIGVYFEANGHGTVLFSANALKQIRKVDPQSPAQLEALTTLRALVDLINQTVGDALSDMLLVEVILAQKDYSVKEWLTTYTDMPNKLIKVLVADKNAYKTVPGTAERKLEQPQGLQEKIDGIVEKYRDGRSFVRASGTEDAVRVYGEAAEPYDVDDMLRNVEQLITLKS
ncbi:hypothetical protein AMS68_000669 [Peltaster fructicola]|uniref:Phosphoacetylglucosamine mutase n=1 Tax=Peltaster fructicola TaxID=286661 RepID=A0A6H0XK96_9PEZI|nr:hypothetical protein AMS68_000669 [Peltaster fructicola]